MQLPFVRTRTDPGAAALYDAIVAEARRPDWYRLAGVEDAMDGRFAVLATLLALADTRLERGGEQAKELAPRLAECFIDDMDAQMREAGFGDPSLGKQVRHLVGSLATRVERWQAAVEDPDLWDEAAARSLYRDSPPGGEAQQRGAAMTHEWWARLVAAGDRDLAKGKAP